MDRMPGGYDKDMEWVWLAVLVVLLGGAAAYFWNRRRTALADARAEAQRWYERLGGQLNTLSGNSDDMAVRQALADAGERYNAAGSQLAQAGSPRQYALARETALEGLSYVRAARVALGLGPGPDLPPLAGQQAAGEITRPRAVDVQGHRYAAAPQPGPATPYHHPGGYVAGRPVPRGWYSEPWWRTALIAGAWGLGTVLVFDALFSPVWADPGYDPGMIGSDAGGYDVDGTEVGDFSGPPEEGDYAEGSFGGDGDFGGGDLGGGDVGGGDFGGGDF